MRSKMHWYHNINSDCSQQRTIFLRILLGHYKIELWFVTWCKPWMLRVITTSKINTYKSFHLPFCHSLFEIDYWQMLKYIFCDLKTPGIHKLGNMKYKYSSKIFRNARLMYYQCNCYWMIIDFVHIAYFYLYCSSIRGLTPFKRDNNSKNNGKRKNDGAIH